MKRTWSAGRSGKPFGWLALVGGLVMPYVYAWFAMIVIAPFGFRGSGVEALYALHPAAIVAMIAFPVVVWWIQRHLRHRGFVSGVIIGASVLALLMFVALGISFLGGA